MSSSRSRRRRSGAILFIVVAFLALGLSLGIAFVFYAHQQAASMRIYREAAQGGRTAHVNQGTRGSTDESPPQVAELASAGLGQLIYDVPDDESGIGSALRGGSLARTMYGLYYSGAPQSPQYSSNDVAYNGIGRYRPGVGSMTPSLLASITDGCDRAVNYTYFPGDGFLRDPERLGFRANSKASAWNIDGVSQSNTYFPLNAPYTYPDEKDIYLAAVRASDGKVLVPSFYRPATFGSLSPDNPNWKNAVGKYLLQRPRPIDMGPGFPSVPPNADGTYTGDIEQLEGKSVRQNDSLWLDLDLPVHKWRGRSYKPLVAYLVVDLDGRINVNTAGNRRGLGNLNASNQGWGGWEIDLQPLLPFNESTRVFMSPKGRYGSDQNPNQRFATDPSASSSNALPVGVTGAFYSQIDFDGSMLTNPGAQSRMQLPQRPSTRMSPIYPQRFGCASLAERTNHPALFNPYLLPSTGSYTSSSSDRVFSPTDLFWLNGKYNGADANYRQAELAQVLSKNLASSTTPGRNGWPATAVNPRFVLTTISNDLDQPGLSPWLLGRPSNFTLVQPPPVNGVYPPALPPSVAGIPFPDLAQRFATSSGPSSISDFDPQTWKARQASLGALDLNRPLADYRVDPTKPYEQVGNVTPASAARAMAERQRFAQDIFLRLCQAAGTQLSGTATGTSQFNGLRYLAQLAANCVDYIDADDYITPFVWNPINPADSQNPANFDAAQLANRVVFGTELPRFVINEGLVRVENGEAIPGQPDTDPGLVPPVPPLGWLPKATFYNVKVWAELHNPLTPGTASTANLAHQGGVPLTFNGNQVYRLLLTGPNNRLRHVENVKGDPDSKVVRTVDLPAGVYSTVDGVVPVSSGAYIQPRSDTSSFYVVGPEPSPGDLMLPSAMAAGMKFRIPAHNYNGGDSAQTTLLLQRLACSHLPPGPTNPYITIDIMEFKKNMMADARVFDDQGLVVPPALGIALQKLMGTHAAVCGACFTSRATTDCPRSCRGPKPYVLPS